MRTTIRVDPGGDGVPDLPRLSRAGIGCLSVLVLLVLAAAAVGPYTEWLWYVHDIRAPQVLIIGYVTRGLLFSIAFLVSLGVYLLCFKRVLSVWSVYSRIPSSLGEQVSGNVLAWLQTRGWTIAKLLSVVLAIMYGSGFSNHWQTYLAWRNAVPFGKTDPMFGQDVGFFVFALPWYGAIVGFVIGLLLMATLISGGLYAGMAALARMAGVQIGLTAIRSHIGVLLGFGFLAMAASVWLSRYTLTLAENPQFTGAGASAQHQMVALSLLTVVLALSGVATFVNIRSGKPFSGPIVGAVASVAVAFLGVGVWPSIFQRFVVEPNRIRQETPFARRAIEMTRWAYSLDRIEVRNSQVQDMPTEADLNQSKATLDQVRLWDPSVMQSHIEATQALRTFYTFHDVDLDRYTIDGRQRMVMLAPRDIRIEGLQSGARTWVNERLRFTHGFAVTLAPGHLTEADGKPVFKIQDVPPTTHPDIPLEQPRIYFSDFPTRALDTRGNYAIVNTKTDEFDYLAETGAVDYRWTGDRGVPVGGLLSRAALSMRLSDGNLLVSPNVTAESRVLMHRSVMTRARKKFPFLRFDTDPYIVVFQGRLIWIIDGYTTTDRIPYSARLRGETISINYIRNPVKITVDAYDGEVRAYVIEPDDPLIRTYMRAYPDLLLPASEVPEGLERHFRYPEDMFVAQAAQLTQYHIESPQAFLNNEDAWDMPIEVGRGGRTEPMRPYYVQMQLPGKANDEFLLILPFSPRGRPTMSGWLAASCDPEDYGRLRLYRFQRGSSLPGPAQMEANFNNDAEIANINKLLNTDQSRIVPGNMLVLPIGQSVLYVKPLFLESRSPGMPQIPELRKVILGLSGRIVVADSYDVALRRLLGPEVADRAADRTPRPTAAPTASADELAPPGSGDAVERERIREALDVLQRAEEALRQGDFGRYGELQRDLRRRLEELAGPAQ